MNKGALKISAALSVTAWVYWVYSQAVPITPTQAKTIVNEKIFSSSICSTPATNLYSTEHFQVAWSQVLKLEANMLEERNLTLPVPYLVSPYFKVWIISQEVFFTSPDPSVP